MGENMNSIKTEEMTNRLNVRKFFETLARVIGEQEGVEIKVVDVVKKVTEKGA